MSVATIRNNHSNLSSPIKPPIKQDPEYLASKKPKKEDICSQTVKTNLNSSNQSTENSINIDNGKTPCQTSINVPASELNNMSTNCLNQPHNYNGNLSDTNGLSNHFSAYNNNSNINSHSGSLDSVGPLPNEIFELLNEFWRPNELVAPDTHLLNGKFSRRSPDASLEENGEDEKEDDLSSLADNEIGADKNTQKRRYSRLSDGYERLKLVLPSVKDKRRVSKARILDEAINYIQRLESVTNVLKREHEKRLNMMNGSNGFFPDYSVQPYVRSLFQKQMYPSAINQTKMNHYPKLNVATNAAPKSPRLKQYCTQNYPPATLNNINVPTNMSADYSYNNMTSYVNHASNSLYQTNDPTQLMNGDSSSPITNNSPFSTCSLSPGNTPTTFQNGSNAVNNSWPYQAGTGSYETNPSQLSSYNANRVCNGDFGTNGAYSSLTNHMWGSIGLPEASSQIVPHSDHSMKVG
ncbi:probable serine/threonine-protein kinase DDB_G0282963 isoform X2 [Hydra vulgaris]|uniref:Probable serine/threonine-protein kinase DDB_G0282963 isoform X2 n=1 Tax=Hydra vulgaris TaxID=6087 RepID=A0ABM4CC04_HYDVU